MRTDQAGPGALVLLGLALCATTRAEMQEPDVLTLDRAVALALERNHRVALDEARLEAASAIRDESRAVRLPRVTLEQEWSRTTNPSLVFSDLLGQESFGAENFAVERLNRPDPQSNVTTRLSLSVPLWSGGGLRAAVAATDALLDASVAARERNRQEIVRDAVHAWTDAVLSARLRSVERESLDTARANVILSRDLHEAGLVVRSDVLRAELRESEVEERLLRSESDEAVARVVLRLTLGLESSSSVHLPATVALRNGVEYDLEALLDEMHARPDLRAAESALEAAEQQLRQARGARLPEIGLRGAWEANDESVPGAEGTNWTLAAGVSLAVFDGGAGRARVRLADQRRVEARQGLLLMRQRVELEVHRAWHALRAARQRLAAASRGTAFGRESLRIVRDRYREGLLPVVDLLDAEAALTGARARDVAARRDLLLAETNLELAVGRLGRPAEATEEGR